MKTLYEIVEDIKPLPIKQKNELIKILVDMITDNNSFADKKTPNEETIQVFKDTDQGKNLNRCKDKQDMFEQLGI